MSVIKSFRNLSKMQFYKNALKIRQIMTVWVLHNFGAKYRLKELKIFAKQISDKDKEKIMNILEPYDINDNKAFNLAVPDWFYDNERNYLHGLTKDLIHCIIKANEIYVSKFESDYKQRRMEQNKAICICFELYSELQYIEKIIPMNLNQLTNLFELLDEEINLLRGWKSSTKKYWDNNKNKG